jgi:hypothetical protein
MSRFSKVFPAGLLAAQAILLAGCGSAHRPWIPSEEHNVTLVSDPLFVRTSEGDYLDGYLAEYESEFRKMRMFMTVEITGYAKGERLITSGKPLRATVRIEVDGRTYDQVPVFAVDRASPNIPSVPKIPGLK